MGLEGLDCTVNLILYEEKTSLYFQFSAFGKASSQAPKLLFTHRTMEGRLCHMPGYFLLPSQQSRDQLITIGKSLSQRSEI